VIRDIQPFAWANNGPPRVCAAAQASAFIVVGEPDG
jgi:hypothetical protein